MKNAPTQTTDRSALAGLHDNSAQDDRQAVMSSREIAELTGKEHRNVLADIRSMLEKLDLHSAEFSAQYQDRMGRSLPSFNLPKDLTLTLVSGYDVSLRYRVVKRLEALEARSNPALIDWTNPAQAARAFADQYEATQRAIATKAEIGSRREATSMNTASQAVKEANRLRIELDKSREYSTIKRMQLLTHGLHFDWRKLKAATVKLGADSIDVFDANYGTVKAYRADVWLEAYGLDISGGCYA